MMGLTITTNVTINYLVPKDIIRRKVHALKLAISAILCSYIY